MWLLWDWWMRAWIRVSIGQRLGERSLELRGTFDWEGNMIEPDKTEASERRAKLSWS